MLTVPLGVRATLPLYQGGLPAGLEFHGRSDMEAHPTPRVGMAM